MEYCGVDMTNELVLAAAIGLAMSALQLFLLQRIIKARAVWTRGPLLAAKLLLWALAFFGVSQWGSAPLIAFGASSGVAYPAASVLYYIRSRKEG